MCNGSAAAKGVPRIIDNLGIRSVPIGIESFADVSRRHVYIDKTLFIATLIDRGGVTLFCRPRRFGKSLALRTLQCFFEAPVAQHIADRRELFRGTAIMDAGERYTAEQGKYPVIYLSLNTCGGDDRNHMLASIAQMMAMEYGRHRYVLDSTDLPEFQRTLFERIWSATASDAELERSLSFLATLLHEYHGQQCVILIDEYDKIVTEGHLHGFRDEATGFLKRWLTGALKGTVDLRLAALTGVQRVSKESIFSDLNNFTVDTPLDSRYAEAFGFTQADVEAFAEHMNRADKIPEAKAWYDGYNFGGEAVYNPWSVLNYFRDGDCTAQPYWTNTSSNDVVRRMIGSADNGVNAQLTRLADGGVVEAPLDLSIVFGQLDSDIRAIWPQLYLAGYVTTDTVDKPNSVARVRTLRVPNLEVAQLFRSELINRAIETAGGRDALARLHDALRSADAAALSYELEQALLNSVSYHDLRDENSCHMWLISIMYAMDGYRFPRSNREVGRGRPDITCEPDAAHETDYPSIVVEAKFAKGAGVEQLQAEAKAALDAQSFPKRYAHDLVGCGALCWGVAFNGSKQVATYVKRLSE